MRKFSIVGSLIISVFLAAAPAVRTQSSGTDQATKEVQMTAKKYEFSPSTVEVSAGTKISACASTIAAMAAKDVTAYYVHMNEYFPRDNPAFKQKNPLQTLTSGFKDTFTLPECQITLPDQKYIKTLHAIKKMQEKGHTKIYIKDLIEFLKEQSVISVKPNKEPRKETSSEYMAIKAIMEKLVGWEYLSISPKRRNRFVELTDKGLNAIDMYLSFDLDEADLKENKNASIVDWIAKLKKEE